MSFLKIYDEEYASKMAQRTDTFRKVFELLEAQNRKSYTIVETGTLRVKDNFAGDGCSTLLFDRFVNHHDGVVYSIDKSKKACELSRSLVSNKTMVMNKDSLNFLRNLFIPIDCLYLDSYDIDFREPHPSALHHLMELCMVFKLLKSGTLVVVDDNQSETSGKGMYVAEFMKKIKVDCIINGYQKGWIL